MSVLNVLNWFVSPAVLFGFGAGGLAVLTEYLYRTTPGPWWQHLWLWIPLQTGIGYCIYRLVTMPNTSLVDAFIIFSFSTISLRVLVSILALNDDIRPGTWAALGLVMLARAAQTWWR